MTLKFSTRLSRETISVSIHSWTEFEIAQRCLLVERERYYTAAVLSTVGLSNSVWLQIWVQKVAVLGVQVPVKLGAGIVVTPTWRCRRPFRSCTSPPWRPTWFPATR